MNGLTDISRRGKWRFFAGLLLPLLCQSCFTGIESTPRITYKDVRRENITVNPEEEMGERFAAVPFSQWQPGRRFTVTDPKASMVYLAPVGKRAEVAPGIAWPTAASGESPRLRERMWPSLSLSDCRR